MPFLQYNVSETKIEERLQEYKHVLQLNLAHPQVQCVHLLTTDSVTTYERFKDMANSSRMLVSKVKSTDFARDPWEYISNNLVGQDVIFSNADIYLGNGFELVDPATMYKDKILYCLTRQWSPKDQCRGEDGELLPLQNYCLKSRRAHDVFLFRLHEPLPEAFYSKLNFDLVCLGMEEVVIWLFENKLKYCVLDPCTILETFHYHCSNLRNKENKPRVADETINKATYFTKKLTCSIKLGGKRYG